MKKAQYTQKFRDAWMKDPLLKEWLVNVESTVGKIAKCKFCICTLTNKYSDLKNHVNSKKHKMNAEIILGKTQTKIPFQSEMNLDATKAAECRIAMFAACHAAISTTDHLVPVCKASFKGMYTNTSNVNYYNLKKCFSGKEAEYLQMHRTKCSAIIKNVLVPHFINNLKEDLADRPFSILIDESTDVSIIKYLGCSIIYFSTQKSSVVSTCLELVELEEANADGIVKAVLQLLNKFNLNVKKNARYWHR
jgi:hypothetical protein